MARQLKQATETSTESSASSMNATIAAVAAAASGASFTAPRKALIKAVRQLASIADARSSMPMLANVSIRVSKQGVVMASTDLSIYCVVNAPDWTVHTEGSVCLPAKKLAEILKGMSGDEVTIRALPLGAEFASGSARAKLVGSVARDFPKIPAILPDDKALALTSVNALILMGQLEKVVSSVCKDETRFHMNGVFVEYRDEILRTVSTDGHRLTKAQCTLIRGGDFQTNGMILPTKGTAAVIKMLGRSGGQCEIGILGPHFLVRFGGTTLAIKIIDAQFPPYEQVIPTDNRRLVTVDRKTLSEALARTVPVCSSTRGVKLAVDDGTLTLSCDSPDTGETRETLDAELSPSGDTYAVGLNPRYLLEAIAEIASDRVTIAFDQPTGTSKRDTGLSPVLVRGTDDATSSSVRESGYLCVIMPMRM